MQCISIEVLIKNSGMWKT